MAADRPSVAPPPASMLPERAPSPLGRYRALVLREGLGAVSGQFPLRGGALAYIGVVGVDLGLADAGRAAALAASHLVAQLRDGLGAAFARVAAIRLDAWIAAAPGTDGLPAILDAASDVLLAHLGPRGEHARTLVPVPWLPGRAPIELALLFAVPDAVTPRCPP